MHRTNKPRGFFHIDHRNVEGKVGIITDTYATPGNVHYSRPFIGCLARQLKRFSLAPLAVGLDAGYFTAPFIMKKTNLVLFNEVCQRSD